MHGPRLPLVLLLCLWLPRLAGAEAWQPELPPWAKSRPAPQVLLILDDRAAMEETPPGAALSYWDLARQALLALVERYAPLGVRFGLLRGGGEDDAWPPPDLVLAPCGGAMDGLRRQVQTWTRPRNPPPTAPASHLGLTDCAAIHLIFVGRASAFPADLLDWLNQRMPERQGETLAPLPHLLPIPADPTLLFQRFDAPLADFLQPWVSGTAPAILNRDDQSEVLLQTGFAPLSGRGDLAAYALPLPDAEAPAPTPLWSASRQLETTPPEQRRILKSRHETARIEDLRHRPLGAIIHAAPLVVGPPQAAHRGTDYVAFRQRRQKRPTRIYVAANDGMLHALRAAAEGDAPPGSEAWAYVPGTVLDRLEEAASNPHPYLLDLTPAAIDAFDPAWGRGAAGWRTVLVGGAGLGGPDYFALDVTDPNAPLPLWESAPFAGARTGTRPVLGPLAPHGHWAALLTSGLRDDDQPGGLRALALVDGRSLPLGAADAPLLEAGSRIAGGAHYALSDPVALDSDGDGLLDLVYAGDSAGTLWQFFLDADAGHWRGQARFHTGGPPIALRPTLVLDRHGDLRIYFGTGRYADAADHADPRPHAFYGLIETRRREGPHPFADFPTRAQTASDLVEVTDFAEDTVIGRALDAEERALLEKNGWFLALQADGAAPAERLAGVPLVVAGTVFFPTLLPSAAPCSLAALTRLHALSHDQGVPARQGGARVLPAATQGEDPRGPTWEGRLGGLVWRFARPGQAATLFTPTSTAPLGFIHPRLDAPALNLRAWREVDF
ncbi:pilus assembly protein [Geoalkalibacter sp.]|uniref:pilus assembly protein n=1 Tax=Geoalkalibacter sp. TaxID=3041440 RepID=UPI00272E062D|nr:PilC/PilY family type IV pilus protein [Geoalkalibacter sp.]